jgi:hypothetical protein
MADHHDAGGIVPRRPTLDRARPVEASAAEVRPEARAARAPAVRRPEITVTGRYLHPETGAAEYWVVDPTTDVARRLDGWVARGLDAAAAARFIDAVARRPGWGPRQG